ncbi:SMI1/KNR4 family protein [Arcicella sp. DC2W]|uniref:SMI1/KNR4 family protein n=1 Tax=Arcicella gelida TaxID=2984195 RepID=A0ABU5S741_9BACT|nr:SMI1/KNR4 family protein [Arcicella sp. DC2W]MEA5404287.1 SMI1/KNR4 family protein [Arcicella sp. DC2W]
MKIDFTEFWDSNYYNNPDLTDEIIIQAERQLGVKLPEIFIKLLKVQNGGYTKGFAFPMRTKTTWADNHIPLSELFGIVLDEKSDSAHNIMQSSYMIEEWGLPDKQVLLTGDGHWWITLDYRLSDKPTIRWIDCECDEDIHVANSFEEFYNRLVSEDEFAEQ